MTAQAQHQIPDYYRDANTETWIDQWPVTWHFSDILVDQVDIKASRHYQNRTTIDVDSDHVSRIALALKDPSVATPPIVVRATDKGTYVVADGNHRIFAHKEAGRSSIYAYVLTCDIETFRQMALTANARNAKSLSEDERQRLIRRMVDSGVQQAVVAKQWGVSPHQVSDIIRRGIGEELLREAGVAAAHERPTTVKEAAARLDSEHLQAIGADLLKQVSGPEMEGLAREILAAKPSQQLDVAKEAGVKLRQERELAKTPKGRRAIAGRGWTARRLANQTIKLANAYAENRSLLNEAEVREAAKQLIAVWEQA